MLPVQNTCALMQFRSASMNEKEELALDELRKRLNSDYHIPRDQLFLLKYLRARDLSPEDAHNLIKSCLDYRKAHPGVFEDFSFRDDLK